MTNVCSMLFASAFVTIMLNPVTNRIGYASHDTRTSENNPNPIFKRMAGQLGLNQQQFDQCVDTKKYQAKIQAHEQLAEQQHIGATPSFIIGGKIIEGPRPYDEFKSIVDDALAKSGSPIATPSETGAAKTTRPAKPNTPR